MPKQSARNELRVHLFALKPQGHRTHFQREVDFDGFHKAAHNAMTEVGGTRRMVRRKVLADTRFGFTIPTNRPLAARPRIKREFSDARLFAEQVSDFLPVRILPDEIRGEEEASPAVDVSLRVYSSAAFTHGVCPNGREI